MMILCRFDYRVALNPIMKITLQFYANKINVHMKSFEQSLAFMMRFKATRKWLNFHGIQKRSILLAFLETSSLYWSLD